MKKSAWLILFVLMMAIPAQAQIPVPTPTALPIDSVNLPINIPTDISLWDWAPNGIQIWNTANRDNVMTGFQAIALIMILGSGVMMVARMYSSTKDNGWESKLDEFVVKDE